MTCTQHRVESTKFRKDVCRADKRCKDLCKLEQVISHIQQGTPLAARHRNHPLREGRYKEAYECHISADWLLVYRKLGNALILMRTGSHADLF